MKRAIFRLHNVEQNIEHALFATPIQPATLSFTPGEQLLVATPKTQAPGVGEYLLAFTVGDYLPDGTAAAGGEGVYDPGLITHHPAYPSRARSTSRHNALTRRICSALRHLMCSSCGLETSTAR